MINIYESGNNFKPITIIPGDNVDITKAVLIDLLNGTKQEEKLIEQQLGIGIPTREEMQEIELSSRLYKENDVFYMTVLMVAKSDSPEPKSDSVTLILAKDKLITVRYIEPHSFALFTSNLPKLSQDNQNAISLLIEFLDVAIDRLADILENVSSSLDEYSRAIFHPKSNGDSPSPNYKQLLQQIGTSGDLNTKVQESLTSFNRLTTFFGKKFKNGSEIDLQSKLTMITEDIKSLRDHVSFLSNKVIFLLDATLGMVNIEQNNIIKIFSIAAVVFLPPTLVASIYGMNFEFMPELKWHLGYPFSLLLMFIAGWLPYKYFKKRKWI